MEIRQLEYFLAVAKYLNFTTAAEHLYVGQPTLSRQIAELEEHLGIQLFVRDNRSVRLSSAGEVFLEEAKSILAKMNEAIEKTRKVGSGLIGSLKIGSVELHNRKLSKYVKSFRQCYPNVGVSLSRYGYGTMSEALINQNIDIGFCYAKEVVNFRELEWKLLYKDYICAMMPNDHPLAYEPEICISDLANESFVLIQSVGIDCILRFCNANGFTPKVVSFIRPQPLSLETLILQVEAGIGIAIVNRKMLGYEPPGLRLVKIKGISYIDQVVAWKKGNQNTSLPLFIEGIQFLERTSAKCS